MKKIVILPLVAAGLMLCLPALAQDTPPDTPPDQAAIQAPPRGEHEALQMVPAQAALKQPIDAAKMMTGAQFEVVLHHRVQLRNGPELPAGTVLVGTVGADDLNFNGTSKLALRFDEARLRNGTTVPIKATIVGVYQAEDMNYDGSVITPGDEVPNSWNDGTLAVDQLGVKSGLDMHSRVASRNSGVLVSSHDNVKLGTGTEFALAIAARPQEVLVQPADQPQPNK